MKKSPPFLLLFFSTVILCAASTVWAVGPDKKSDAGSNTVDGQSVVPAMPQVAQRAPVACASTKTFTTTATATRTDSESGRATKKVRTEPIEEKEFNLDESDVVSLTALPQSVLAEMAACTSLSIDDCQNLKDLEGIGMCKNLTHLAISECDDLQNVLHVADCPQLQYLYVDSWPINFQGVGACKNLKTIVATGTDLSGIEECLALESLKVFDAIHIPNLAPCTKLVDVDLFCFNLRDMRGVLACNSIQKLNMSHCKLVENLLGETMPRSLKILEIDSDCSDIQSLSGLKNCPDLERLHIRCNVHVQALNDLAACQNLKSITLMGCPELLTVAALGALDQLEDLGLWLCKKLVNLQGLENLASLTHLTLHGGGSNVLHDFTPLAHLTGLQALHICTFKTELDLTPITQLQLRSLEVAECPNFVNMAPIGQLISLEKLRITNCEQLSDISPIGNLTNLKELRLPSLEALSNIEALRPLVNLTMLNLAFNDKICDITPLAGMQDLAELILTGCRKVQDLTPVEELKRQSLKTYYNVEGVRVL